MECASEQLRDELLAEGADGSKHLPELGELTSYGPPHDMLNKPTALYISRSQIRNALRTIMASDGP
jgi:hypothetical protein